jgi:hypothetical protein
MSFEQCAKQMHRVVRSSLRDYARAIEVFRELEEKSGEEATKAKAQSYRSIAPMIMRIGSALIGALNIGLGICPQAAKHSYDWISKKCPVFPEDLFSRFSKSGEFDYLEFGNTLSRSLSSGQELFKIGLEIQGNYEQADRTETDARIQKARDLGDRRTKEAQERQSDSDELLRLLQQMNREIADAIRSIARG